MEQFIRTKIKNYVKMVVGEAGMMVVLQTLSSHEQ